MSGILLSNLQAIDFHGNIGLFHHPGLAEGQPGGAVLMPGVGKLAAIEPGVIREVLPRPARCPGVDQALGGWALRNVL